MAAILCKDKGDSTGLGYRTSLQLHFPTICSMLVLIDRGRKLRTHSTKQQEATICLIVISRVGHSLPLLNLAVYPLQVFLIATDDGKGNYLGDFIAVNAFDQFNDFRKKGCSGLDD